MDIFISDPATPDAPDLSLVTGLGGGGLLSVVEAGPDLWPSGVEVVAAAQALTGFPSDIDPRVVLAHTARRQARALNVWIASATTGQGSVVVGHALLTAVAPDHPGWREVEDPEVATALAEASLVELGGLAVRPGWMRLGVAEALVVARLAWLRERGLVGGSSVWHGSAGSTRLAERYGRRVHRRTDVDSDRFVYGAARLR